MALGPCGGAHWHCLRTGVGPTLGIAPPASADDSTALQRRSTMAADTGLPDIPYEEMTPEQRRDIAIRRIKAKSDFRVHLVVYLIINGMFIVFWAFTSNVLAAGAGSPGS